MASTEYRDMFYGIVAAAVVGLVAWFALSALGQQPRDDLRMTSDKSWIYFMHESDTEYILRSKAIIGFVSPIPGDPKERSGVLLQNGATVMTTVEIEEFHELLETEFGDMNSVLEIDTTEK